MRTRGRVVVSAQLVSLLLGFPLLLAGCDSTKEGTMVEKTEKQIEGEKASMKGMMEAMKNKAQGKR